MQNQITSNTEDDNLLLSYTPKSQQLSQKRNVQQDFLQVRNLLADEDIIEEKPDLQDLETLSMKNSTSITKSSQLQKSQKVSQDSKLRRVALSIDEINQLRQNSKAMNKMVDKKQDFQESDRNGQDTGDSLNFMKKFKLFLNVKNYSKRITQLSSSYNWRSIMQEQQNLLEIINDNAYYQKNFQKKQYLKYNIEILNPHCTFYVIWSCSKLIAILFGLYITALEITFDIQQGNNSDQDDQFYFYWYIFMLGMFDILITFNVGIYIEGNIIDDRKIIAKQYFNSQFIIDFLGTIAFFLQKVTGENLFLLLFMFRILQINKILTLINNIYQIQQRRNTIYELTKLLFTIVYVAHFVACLFYQVAQIEIQKGETKTWIQEFGYTNLKWNEIYIESLYFSFITMITVGYGDISPTTYSEKIVTILLTLISCGIFAYAVNTIGDIFRDLQTKQASIKMKKFYVSQYMDKRNIDKVKKMKVIKSLEYMDEQEERGNIKGLQILFTMQKNIQEDIFNNYYSNVLQHSQFIKQGKYSQDFINSLSIKMHEITISPEQNIYHQGQIEDKYYILMEGTLEVKRQRDDNKEQFICLIKGGFNNNNQKSEQFGLSQLYKNCPSEVTVKSSSVARLVYFNINEMIQLLRNYPEDYQSFKNFQTNIQTNQLHRHLIQCYVCNSFTHFGDQCCKVNYICSKQKIISIYNKPYFQEQKRFFRGRTEKENALSILENIKDDLMHFRYKFSLEILQLDEQIPEEIFEYDIEFYMNMPQYKYDQDTKQYQPQSEDEFTDTEAENYLQQIIIEEENKQKQQQQQSQNSLHQNSNMEDSESACSIMDKNQLQNQRQGSSFIFKSINFLIKIKIYNKFNILNILYFKIFQKLINGNPKLVFNCKIKKNQLKIYNHKDLFNQEKIKVYNLFKRIIKKNINQIKKDQVIKIIMFSCNLEQIVKIVNKKQYQIKKIIKIILMKILIIKKMEKLKKQISKENLRLNKLQQDLKIALKILEQSIMVIPED